MFNRKFVLGSLIKLITISVAGIFVPYFLGLTKLGDWLGINHRDGVSDLLLNWCKGLTLIMILAGGLFVLFALYFIVTKPKDDEE